MVYLQTINYIITMQIYNKLITAWPVIGKLHLCPVLGGGPVWKVCIAQPRYWARNFDALIYLLVNFANLGRTVFKLSSQGGGEVGNAWTMHAGGGVIKRPLKSKWTCRGGGGVTIFEDHVLTPGCTAKISNVPFNR